MTTCRTSISSALLLTLITGGLLMAHPDDPKGMIKRVPYVGPGYRSAAVNADAAFLAAGDGPAIDFPSVGVELLSWLPLGAFEEPISGSDCWGYVSPTGREYAIMGLRSGTGFVDITDPGLPIVLGVIPGAPSTWRDIKVYGAHAYSVTEGFNGGIQVIDLSLIDSGSVTLVNTVQEDVDDPILATGSSHNVAIDEAGGFLYRCGGGNNGLRIYSLADPEAPVFVGAWSDRYVHDAQVVTYDDGPYAGRQIAFCCSGFNGGSVETGLDILDVTDKDNIVNLSRLIYANGFYSHQAWLSPDRTWLYLNDESDETALGIPTDTKVFDVSDLANPIESNTFTNGSAAIGHNLYTLGHLIFEANYRSGIRVFDASDPLSPVEVAYFDSYPEDDHTTFNGMWSVYPYFPSGTFIGSDIEKGLFVLRLEDCNDNGVLDDDEIAADPALDCNLNGVPDDCDIADGTSTDDNGDGVPDDCLDCNSNGQSDIVDVLGGASGDCNGNGVPDECEADCNANGVPDECELFFNQLATGPLGPVVGGQTLTFTAPAVPESMSDVQFVFTASADLAGSAKSIDVIMNNVTIVTLFPDAGSSCPDAPDRQTFTYGITFFNIIRQFDPERDMNFRFVPSDPVDGAACADSFITMEISYRADQGGDENGNGVPDECDPPVCQGLEATVYVDLFGNVVGGYFDGLPYFGILFGSHDDDVIVGTDGNDIILGFHGDDVICALGGDDFIMGNHGDDRIDAGDGYDIVLGNRGLDWCTNGERVRGCENKPLELPSPGRGGLRSRR